MICLLTYNSCREVGTSVDSLVGEFEAGWKPEIGQYSRKFVEYCSAKALSNMCQNIEEKISDGSFSRMTYDMMVAWEMPSACDEESRIVSKEQLSFSYLFSVKCDNIITGKEN